MFKPRNNTDSYAPVQSNLTFFNGPLAKDAVSVDTAKYLQAISLEMTGVGSWIGSLDLFDPDGDYLEGLALAAGANRKLTFGFGWDFQGYVPPQFNASILTYTPKFTVDGVHLHCEVMATEAVVALEDKRGQYFQHGYTATQIFKIIAKNRGWRLTDANGKSTVEESAGFMKEFSYTLESDLNFIVNKLLPRAHNANGDGFVFFFDKQGAAHFQSTNGAGQLSNLAAEFVFAGDTMGDVISFEPTDNVFGVLLQGGGNTSFRGVGSSDGGPTEIKSDAFSGVTDSTKLTTVGDGVAKPAVAPDKEHARKYFPGRDDDDLRQQSTSYWSWLNKFAYVADLHVRGTHAVDLFDFVKVRFIKKNGADHYMGGVFRVIQLKHEFNHGGWTTYMGLNREGTLPTTETKNLDVKNRLPGEVTATTQVANPNPTGGGAPSETVQASTVNPGN